MKRIKQWLLNIILPEYGTSSTYSQITISYESGQVFKKGDTIATVDDKGYICEKELVNNFYEIHILKLNKIGKLIIAIT